MAADTDTPVAVITGSTGIAGATARLLSRAGCQLVMVDNNQTNLAEIKNEHPEALTVHADLTEPDAARHIVDRAMDAHGRLDILVNVVGISGRRFGDGPAHQCTDEGWETVMSVNATTTFRMCRAALAPMMEAGAGSIVNVASVLAYSPSAEHFATHAYAASKGAIISLTQSMAAFYADNGIRVNAVAPGLIATPMSKRAQENVEIGHYLNTRQPLTGDFGEAEDVAEAIGYLALNSGRFVTGTVLEVAGGWSVAG